MSETKETKEKSGGSGIGWVLLLILGVLAVKVFKIGEKIVDTPENDLASDGSGGGGSSGYDGAYVDDVIVVDVGNGDTGNGGSYSGGVSSGSVTPIKQAMTARTLDPEWQYQKSRINMAVIPDYQKRQIEKGAVTKNTLKSIADYQQVKAGTMSAYDYAGGAAAMPGIDPVAYDYASTAYQGSATTVRNRALSYYAGQTGTHRGSMSAAERTAWDSANEQAALTAYAAAAGSGLQADTARALASKTNLSTVKTPTTKTGSTSVQSKMAIANSKGTSGLGLGASKGSSQPGKSSSSSTAKTATKTVAKAAAKKGIAGAVKAAASLSKK